LNVIRQINSGTHPLTSELAKRTNRNRIANGTHHFLNDEWAIDCSDRAKKRVTDGNHNFMGKSGSDLQNELLRQGRHSSQIDGAAKRVTERNLKMVEEGTHPWVGETHSNRMKELAAKRLAEGSHNSQVISKCPYCSKEGKGAAMFRWHFDNCKLKRVE
jgi:hypothetical protein